MIFVISRMFLSKIPTVFGFVSINRGVGADGGAQRVEVHAAVCAGRDVDDLEAAHRGGRGVVPWAESGTMIFVRLKSPRSV